jgi:hypothetical protein
VEIDESFRSVFREAMVIAIVADALQIVVFPFFVEGALSPAADILDLGVAALLVNLLGWHWEFLPSFFAKVVPGVDLVPFLDAGGGERVSQIEANRGRCRSEPGRAPGAKGCA